MITKENTSPLNKLAVAKEVEASICAIIIPAPCFLSSPKKYESDFSSLAGTLLDPLKKNKNKKRNVKLFNYNDSS